MYYLLFFSSLIIFFSSKDRENNKLFMLLIGLMIAVTFLRFGAGADYFSYEYLYNNIDPNAIIDSYNYIPNMEPLFKMIMIIGRLLNIPYHLFSGLISSIITILMGKFIREKSPEPLLSLIIYISTFFIVWSLSALRQGLVIAVLLNVYFNEKYTISNKIVISLIMFFIHSSAVAALVMYLATKIKVDKKLYLIALIVVILFSAVPAKLSLGFLKNIKYLNKIVYYIDEDQMSLFSFTALTRLCFFSLVYYYYDRLVEKYLVVDILNFILINYIVYFLLMFSRLTAARISVYGYMCLIIIIPMILSLYSKNPSRLIAIAIIIGFSVVSFYKEMDTLVAQTGYSENQVSLNKESIFNKHRDHFSNVYNFDTNNKELNSEYSKSYSNIRSESPVIDAKYHEENQHISVKFEQNGLYGVINQKGEIVELPTSPVRTNIVGEYVENISNPYDFKTIIFRKLGSDDRLTFHETIALKEEAVLEGVRFDVHWYSEELFDITKLAEETVLSNYNIESIKEAKIFKTDFHPEVSYVKIDTPISSYYLVLNSKGNIITELLYGKFTPFDQHGIAKGYTNDEIHYLNKDGEVIWIEK